MNRVYLERNRGDGWTEVDTFGGEDVLFTFTLDNLVNPTQYVAEHAYSLHLPRTAGNNAFFGQFGHPDSLIVAGGYDPTHTMRYMATDSAGMILSTGDAVVSEIDGEGYILSLAGSRAMLFSRLLNAGYDTRKAAEDARYTLMTDWLKTDKGGDQFSEGDNKMTAAAVLASWLIDSPIFDFATLCNTADLLTAYGIVDSNVTETLAFIASLVGFAPTTQGRYKDFDSEQWLEVGTLHTVLPPPAGDVSYRPPVGSPGYTTATYLPVLCKVRNTTNIPEETVEVKDGLIEPQMSEYRSYYQQPYIYVSALWQLMASDFAAITDGYTLTLDGRWFNENNDELRRLVYMLPQLYGEESPVGDKIAVEGTSTHITGASGHTSSSPQNVLTGIIDEYVIADVVTLESDESAAFDGRVALSLGLSVPTVSPDPLYFSPTNAIRVEVGLDDSGHYYRKGFIVCPIPTDGKITENDYWTSTYLDLYEYVGIGYTILFPKYTPFNDDALFFLQDIDASVGSVFDASLRTNSLYVETAFVTDYNAILYFDSLSDDTMYTVLPPKLGIDVAGTAQVFEHNRSGCKLSLEVLFRDIKPFDILLQYSKSRHLLWLVDDNSREVRVVRAKDFYDDAISAGLEGLSENASLKDAKIRPLSWQHHSVVMNMAAVDADHLGDYAKRYGNEYGSKVLVTQNALNDEREELLGHDEHDTVKTSAMASATILRRSDIEQQRQNFIEWFPQPLNVKDGEQANVSGNFYYRHDNATWEIVPSGDASRRPTVHITDDTAKEQMFRIFCWHGDDAYLYDYAFDQYFVDTTVRPVFNTVSEGGLSVLFAPVREVYTSQPDQPSAYLYERCWQGYVEEAYNVQNKTLEAYIHLPRQVFDKVRRNPLVIIDHIAYLVAEIRSWGEDNTIVRCTMRQISDINKLKS